MTLIDVNHLRLVCLLNVNTKKKVHRVEVFFVILLEYFFFIRLITYRIELYT